MRWVIAMPVMLAMLGFAGGVMAQGAEAPAAVQAEAPAGANEVAKGSFRIEPVAEDRSPHSPLEVLAGRLGMNLKAILAGEHEKTYDVTAERFEAWVPEEYVDDGSWGLVVWVSPGGSGSIDQGRAYVESFRKHKLIWVGANNSGNPRPSWIRIGLALDGAHLMNRRYRLDRTRVYVMGVSGGGRISSMTAVSHPEVFAGGMYIVGCNFYRQIAVPEKPGHVYRKSFSPPPGKLFRDSKTKSRHVLLTGETDGNRLQTHTYFHQGFKKDGFEHAIYLEVPGMGHRAPPLEWFEKGMSFLEEREAPATKPVAKGPATRPVREAPRPVASVEEEEAGRMLRVAKIFVSNQRWMEARERLERIVKEHGGTEAGTEAKRILGEIREK